MNSNYLTFVNRRIKNNKKLAIVKKHMYNKESAMKKSSNYLITFRELTVGGS